MANIFVGFILFELILLGHPCFAESDSVRPRHTSSDASCGGALHDDSGIIKSPKFDQEYYPDSTQCIWRISLKDKKKVIRLNFEAFELEDGDKCSYDYLAIYDGNRPSRAKLIGKFCGTDFPSVINSTSNQLYLKFQSDGSVSKSGFKLRYEASSGCDKNFFQSKGVVTSPLYPKVYPSDAVCKYVITVPENQHVKLTFADIELEDDVKCKFDYVEIFDTYEADEASIGRFCGKNVPKSAIRTIGNVMILKFVTDVSVKGRGFKANFEGVLPLRCYENNGNCQHNCTEGEYGRVCTCAKGFKLNETDGVSCQDINECADNNGGCSGQCVNTVGSFHCKCPPGYIKDDVISKCRDVDECKNSNGGCDHVCKNTIGSYYCQCRFGYKANGHKCIDVNECKNGTHPCSQKCVNTDGSYHCEYIDECLYGGNKCEQVCVNTPGSYNCSCLDGFKPDSLMPNKCVDINECIGHLPGCHNCVNTKGSYFCECNRGYEPNDKKTKCVDTNECKVKNGGCSFTCVNLDGSHYCKCLDGFKPVDKKNSTCVDINECASNNTKGPCDQICTNKIGSYECGCYPGYKMENGTCVDIDECLLKKCDQDCTNLPGGFKCECRAGFIKDETKCLDIDECRDGTHKCDSIAKCKNTPGDYQCTCPPGYQLINKTLCKDVDECQTALNICDQHCNNINGSCFFHSNFHESPLDIDECAVSNNTCINAISCSNSIGGFHCTCGNGLTLASDNRTCIATTASVIRDLSCRMTAKVAKGKSGCEQKCENTPGSYKCSCDLNYKLSKDKKSCQVCPTCSDFQNMKEAISQLQKQIKQLQADVLECKKNAAGLNNLHSVN
eukprot:gene7036-7824_t